MVRAFLISFVARQSLVLPAERMAEAYPHAWLVWEPGAWTAPGPGKQMTLVPAEPGLQRPGVGDALCFELALPRGKEWLKIGRADDCDVVINDATVSRGHLMLTPERLGEWAALVSPASRGATLDDVPLVLGQRHPLVSGAKLGLGDVVLTYLDAPGFLARAKQELDKAGLARG